MGLRDRVGVIGETLFWLLVLLVFSSGIYAYGMWQYSWLLPWQKSVECQVVEQSKSFVDANNNQLENYKLEYVRLDVKIAKDKDNKSVYEVQQNAILERMCREISTMNKSTVNTSMISWINSVGGCN